MAFGSFFKKIAKGVKNVVSKAAPIVSKVAKAVAPVFGGTVGNVLNTVGNFADKADAWANGDKNNNNNDSHPQLQPQYSNPQLGLMHNMGRRRNPGRFDVPMLK